MSLRTEASEPGQSPGFEDLLTLLFAAWTVTGHVSFLAGVTLRHYWLLAASLGLVAAMIAVGIAIWRRRTRTDRASGRDGATWAAMVLAVVLVLCLHRSDADDRIYVGQQMKALDAPEQSFWAMADVKDYNAGYVMSSYEYVRAGFSWLTGVPVLASYYLIWPALIAVMAVAYQSRLFGMLGVRSMVWAFAFWFVVMLAWGNTHRTPPNFGFVRMFQGKGALIWVTIPAAQYYWLRFAASGDRRAAVLLCATLVAGVGFTPTGIPTGVLLAGLFGLVTLLGHGRTRRGWTVAAVVAGAGVYPVLIGLLMRFYFAHTPQSGYLPPELLALGTPASAHAGTIPGAPVEPPATPVVVPPAAPAPAVPAPTAPVAVPTPAPAVPPTQDVSLVDVLLVLGAGWRPRVVIACLLLSAFVLRRTPARSLFGLYVILCALLLGVPATSRLIGEASYTSFAWRWIFVIPFVLSTALVAERIATWFERRWMQGAAVLALSTGFVLLSPLRVISAPNGTSFGRPDYKLPPGDSVSLLGYDSPAWREGLRLVSPATGKRH